MKEGNDSHAHGEKKMNIAMDMIKTAIKLLEKEMVEGAKKEEALGSLYDAVWTLENK